MPLRNSISARVAEIRDWRRDLHQHPELGYEETRTAAIVADKLRAFGFDEVVTSLGKTGVVGVLKGRLEGNSRIGLRADMDALPIEESSGVPHSSRHAGKMHACGHDGHTAMLLGAAEALAETRAFAGEALFIFQPAEEGGAGAQAMIDDQLFTRFPCQQVFGLHNMPGLPVGSFSIRTGAIMAAPDQFTIRFNGKGGHAAMPHNCIDPVVMAAHFITAAQTLVSRRLDPVQAQAVVSITRLRAGEALNVIPETAEVAGTVRTLDAEVRNAIEAQLTALAQAQASAFGGHAEVSYARGYPVTVNEASATAFAAEVAAKVVGAEQVDRQTNPVMGGEDFAYMLEAKPGAYIFMGNGDTAGLHHPAYDFNDEALAYGVSYWVELVEQALAA